MNALPSCRLELTAHPDEWREWLRGLAYDDLIECRERLSRESLNTVTPVIAAAMGAIIGVIDGEYVRRFPMLADAMQGAVKITIEQAEIIVRLQAQLAGTFTTENVG